MGEVADLTACFDNDDDRRLAASFLRRLLIRPLDDPRVTANGVRIIGAVVMEPLDLTNESITHEIWIDQSKFAAPVTFSGSVFHRRVTFEETAFNGAAFDLARFSQDLVVDGATFRGDSTFERLEVGGDLRAEGAKWKDAARVVRFSNMRVGGTAVFRRARFACTAEFDEATVSGAFAAERVKFINSERSANFNTAKLSQNANFTFSTFEGPADFTAVTVGNQLQMQDADFGEISLASAKIGGEALLQNAVFVGSVDATSMKVQGAFRADQAAFLNSDGTTDFTGARFSHSAHFGQTEFGGAANFAGMTVSGDLYVNDANFSNMSKGVNFDGMKVEGDASFTGTTIFRGSVRFVASTFRGALDLRGAQFLDVTDQPNFGNMTVSGSFFMARAYFGGGVSFVGADISGDFEADDVRIHGTQSVAEFENLKVGRSLFMRRATFWSSVYFTYATVRSFDIGGSTWPASPNIASFDGLTFQYVSAGNNPETSAKNLVTILSNTPYSAEVYANLDTFFRREGRPDLGDEVFLEGKTRERQDVFWRTSKLKWAWSWLLYALVRHGRRPELAFAWSAAVVLLGYVVFRRRADMEPQKPEFASRTYNALWYSLDLFAPVINLEAANAWRPKSWNRLAWFYLRLHRLLGWILIPIAVAAITGILK